MTAEDCKAGSVRKRDRGQDESQEKEFCKKPVISKEGIEKSCPAGSLEDLEYINLEKPLQYVDEERVRGLMRELMQELGIIHDAAAPAPALGGPGHRGGSTSDQNYTSSYDYDSNYNNYSQNVWHLDDVEDFQTFPGVEEAELSRFTRVDDDIGDCTSMPRHLSLVSDGHVEIIDDQADLHTLRTTAEKPMRCERE